MDWTLLALWWLIGIPTLLVQLVLARHALRAGSIPWTVLILMAPVIGVSRTTSSRTAPPCAPAG
jgi:hypothetical protein